MDDKLKRLFFNSNPAPLSYNNELHISTSAINQYGGQVVQQLHRLTHPAPHVSPSAGVLYWSGIDPLRIYYEQWWSMLMFLTNVSVYPTIIDDLLSCRVHFLWPVCLHAQPVHRGTALPRYYDHNFFMCAKQLTVYFFCYLIRTLDIIDINYYITDVEF